MKHTLINIALFCGIVGCMVGIQAIDDNSAEHEVAKQELVKQNRPDRFEKAAREICGENAGWALTQGKNEIVCKTHRGHKTGRVAQL